MSNKLSFGMIESPWHKRLSYSARPIFDLFSHVAASRIDGYNYERVIGPASFKEVLTVQLRQKLEFVLVSCHGERGDLIFLHSHERVSAVSIKSIINNANYCPVGFFVDACEFSTYSNAKNILSTGVTWFASFKKEVEWLESASFVLLFYTTFHELLGQTTTERSRIKRTMKILRTCCPGLIKKLGFHLYIRESRNRIVDLARL